MNTTTNEIPVDAAFTGLLDAVIENVIDPRCNIASQVAKIAQLVQWKTTQQPHTAEHTRAELPKNYVPIWEKSNLTLEESASYFGIGINKLRELTNDKRCDCVIFVGSKRLIKRKKFEKFLETAYSI